MLSGWVALIIMLTRPSLITGLTQMGLEIEETGWNGWIRRSSPPFCPRAARYQPLMANEPGLTSATELYLCPAKVHLKHETLRQVNSDWKKKRLDFAIITDKRPTSKKTTWPERSNKSKGSKTLALMFISNLDKKNYPLYIETSQELRKLPYTTYLEIKF